MKRAKAVFAMAFVVIFLIGACLTATDVLAGGYGGKHGRFGHDPFFMLIHKLNLTDEQKATVAGILNQHLSDLKNAVSSLATDRAAMIQAALSGDNSTIESTSETLGKDVANLAQLHARITHEMITTLTLTQEQQNTLTDMQGKIGSHVGAMIDARFTHLEKWIAKHSNSQ